MGNNRYHASLMSGYYSARQAWETERDSVCYGYQTEESEWEGNSDRPLFKQWLINQRSDNAQ